MNNKFYTEQKHKETMNSVDMLQGSINRMCVTADLNELRERYTSAMLSLTDLYNVNRQKLLERFSSEEEGCLK
jgi:hypothetical protein